MALVVLVIKNDYTKKQMTFLVLKLPKVFNVPLGIEVDEGGIKSV